MKLDFASLSKAGKYHPNQDTIHTLTDVTNNYTYGLFIVADGMGGHPQGTVASQIVVEKISQKLQKECIDNASELTLLSNKDLERHLKQQTQLSVELANDAVYAKSSESDVQCTMASTVACVLVFNNLAVVANVGDSRVYLLRHNKLRQITNDHTMAQAGIDAGLIKVNEFELLNFTLTRAMGLENIEVDIFTQWLETGDRLLICSDGIWATVSDENLEQFLLIPTSLKNVADEIMMIAKQDHIDDSSLIIVEIKEEI